MNKALQFFLSFTFFSVVLLSLSDISNSAEKINRIFFNNEGLLTYFVNFTQGLFAFVITTGAILVIYIICILYIMKHFEKWKKQILTYIAIYSIVANGVFVSYWGLLLWKINNDLHGVEYTWFHQLDDLIFLVKLPLVILIWVLLLQKKFKESTYPLLAVTSLIAGVILGMLTIGRVFIIYGEPLYDQQIWLAISGVLIPLIYFLLAKKKQK
ncbi:hypothetical protein [Mangrovibacillus cuniculi]|uniref:Uncharacterized protein n=1 Tax=Mangrovibacillus cuniculi TaxID=2593652 RepID=A0A7S8CCT2_9BACI|nr:hypothetical protein [Mangrovibacillus cuniculi]QPC47604.1 hypothetical protein G8O30_11895 [Mangrovibacillus cuniculi]